MIFDTLQESNAKGELLLLDGGYCRYHLRRDGQLTIYEIISQRPGVGTALLDRLVCVEGARFLLARCPATLPSNAWYERRGFVRTAIERTARGTELNVWLYWL